MKWKFFINYRDSDGFRDFYSSGSHDSKKEALRSLKEKLEELENEESAVLDICIDVNISRDWKDSLSRL